MDKIIIKAVHGESARMLLQAITTLFPECEIDVLSGTPLRDENDDDFGLMNCRIIQTA